VRSIRARSILRLYRLSVIPARICRGLIRFFDLLGSAAGFYYPRSDTVIVVVARSGVHDLMTFLEPAWLIKFIFGTIRTLKYRINCNNSGDISSNRLVGNALGRLFLFPVFNQFPRYFQNHLLRTPDGQSGDSAFRPQQKLNIQKLFTHERLTRRRARDFILELATLITTPLR